MGFEPAISKFKRAKTFRALDSATTVIGSWLISVYEYKIDSNIFTDHSLLPTQLTEGEKNWWNLNLNFSPLLAFTYPPHQMWWEQPYLGSSSYRAAVSTFVESLVIKIYVTSHPKIANKHTNRSKEKIPRYIFHCKRLIVAQRAEELPVFFNVIWGIVFVITKFLHWNLSWAAVTRNVERKREGDYEESNKHERDRKEGKN